MDWKEQLALLAGSDMPRPEELSKEVPQRRKRTGVVYSTDPDYAYSTDEAEDEAETLPAGRQPLRLSMERAGRGGKTVTLVRGFRGTEEDLVALARQLKARLGLGGSAKDGEIVIQGDVRQRLQALLHEMGYRQAK